VGQQGESLSDLRPTGIALIGGKRVDVVTRGELLERGSRVQVLMIEGNRVVVGAIKPGPTA
jgi:membrane-bound serine protease (ClpP class)